MHILILHLLFLTGMFNSKVHYKSVHLEQLYHRQEADSNNGCS